MIFIKYIVYIYVSLYMPIIINIYKTKLGRNTLILKFKLFFRILTKTLLIMLLFI